MDENEKTGLSKDKQGAPKYNTVPQSEVKADLEENKNKVRYLLWFMHVSVMVSH